MKSHSSKLFLAAMALLLALRVFVYTMDSSWTPPTPGEVAVAPLTPSITPASPDYLKVKRLIEPRKSFAESDYAKLIQYNMFDPKNALNAPQIIQQANQ